jgi:hypothetical protein
MNQNIDKEMVGHDLIICSRYKSTLLFIDMPANGFFLCGEGGHLHCPLFSYQTEAYFSLCKPMPRFVLAYDILCSLHKNTMHGQVPQTSTHTNPVIRDCTDESTQFFSEWQRKIN